MLAELDQTEESQIDLGQLLDHRPDCVQIVIALVV